MTEHPSPRNIPNHFSTLLPEEKREKESYRTEHVLYGGKHNTEKIACRKKKNPLIGNVEPEFTLVKLQKK